MATPQNRPPVNCPVPLEFEADAGGVRISITDQRGQCYRYRAQAMTLSIKKGVVEVIENKEGTYIWFDRGDLEIRHAARNLHFHFKSGAASNLPGPELTILAELGPSVTKTKKRGERPS